MKKTQESLIFPNKEGLNNPKDSVEKRKTGPKDEPISKQLLNLKEKTSWSWERMCREFHRVMGQEGPSHTTLHRYAVGKFQRRNILTERYVAEAIHKTTVELIQRELSTSETRRERTEKELQQTEVRFRQLVENAKDLIFRYRLVPPGGFEYISPVVQDMLGYSPEEFYADPWLVLKILHPEDDQHKIEKGLQGKGPLHERATLRWVHKDGSLVWTEDTKVPIYDEAGNLVAIEGVARDITERKQDEEKLRESQELFRQIAENIQEVLFVVDFKDYRVLYVSPAYEEVWGRTCESLLKDPRAWLEAIVPEDRERILAALGRQQRTGEYNEKYRIARPDNSVRWIHDRVFSLRNAQGDIYRLVGIAQDITERVKGYEEASTMQLGRIRK